MRPAVIVVADDEARQRETLARVLRGAGHEVVEVSGGGAAVAEVMRGPVDLVITDLRMPDLTGMEVLAQVRQAQPEVAVVLLTAFGTVANAVEAMKAGAADYLAKPVDLDELEIVVGRALERRELQSENRRLRRRLQATTMGFRLLGHSAALQDALARAARAAETDAPLLVSGESGTGKELLARSVHALGRRSERPFVTVSCAALPDPLLASELFGLEEGGSARPGRVERAAGGTLFLDEVDAVPPGAQLELLRLVRDRRFTRQGGEEPREADVRIVAAARPGLERMVEDGGFRADLYYALAAVSLTLPPLRERREDIPELVEHFLARFAGRYDRTLRSVSREAMDALVRYEYPGNVRELENAVEQATVLAQGHVLTLDDLPVAVRRGEPGGSAWPPGPEAARGGLPRFLEEVERRLVLEALSRYSGNQSSAARELGLTESGLRYKLKKWEGRG